ncbi:hypothetical protein [Methylomonas sp. LWB]|uniref:hypothetical protein n=1 Tax=Methylomonas sp. LWB TaxID=1905845 RepID=UPI0011152193|nr:hypothetical protein [Methylomonas sp. LWB]
MGGALAATKPVPRRALKFATDQTSFGQTAPIRATVDPATPNKQKDQKSGACSAPNPAAIRSTVSSGTVGAAAAKDKVSIRNQCLAAKLAEQNPSSRRRFAQAGTPRAKVVAKSAEIRADAVVLDTRRVERANARRVGYRQGLRQRTQPRADFHSNAYR